MIGEGLKKNLAAHPYQNYPQVTPPPPIPRRGPAKDKHQNPTNRRAIKEKTIAINRDWVYNEACRIPHDINVVSHSFI